MSRADINLIYQLRNQYKRLDQVTWTIRDAQQRFPLTTPENQIQLTTIYLAMLSDIEDVVNEIKEIKKEYGK